MADQPGYTRMPNALLELMPQLGDAEMRVVFAIARKTLGWQKECDVISITQLEQLTGLRRPSVVAGLKAALERGVIERTAATRNGFCYRLVNLLNQSSSLTSKVNEPDLVNLLNQSAPPLVKLLNTQKKDLKEKKESVRSARAKRADRPPAQSNLDSLHEAVKRYKQLTGSRPPPTIETLIATTVVDCSAWEVAIKAWCGRGFKPSNAEGMIDWYLHPEKQQGKNHDSKHLRQSLNGHSERGKLSAADPERGF